jgi:hypothetical protein
MAIFHHHETVISRSKGRSTVQVAAYITGQKLEETRRDLIADFRKKASTIACWEQLAPEGSPQWCNSLNFWNELESFEDQWAQHFFKKQDALEKHINTAQTGHTIVIALPKELNIQTYQAIAREIAQRAFISQRHVVLYGIHNEENNPHVHFLVSRRTLTEAGELSFAKNRALSTKDALLSRRELTAEVINQALKTMNIEQQVDHRSFTGSGLALVPTQHEGYISRKRLRNGEFAYPAERNKQIYAENKQRVIQNPDLILQELRWMKKPLNAETITDLIKKRIGDDPVLYNEVYRGVMKKLYATNPNVNQPIFYFSRKRKRNCLENDDGFVVNKRIIKNNSYKP